jgi:hypothetical protein
MALAGYLLRPGRLGEETVLKLMRAAWHAAGADSKEALRDLEGIVRDTAENLAAGEPVVGGSTLDEYAHGMVRLLSKWWSWSREERPESGPEEKEDRRNQADRLIGYALKDVENLFVDQHGAPHALVDGEPLPLNSRCYPNLKPLPDPRPGGDAKALASYANLKTNRDKRLFIAYIVTAPLPHVGRPILNASGAMGSGKTTIGRMLKRLLDPTAPETVRLDPRDFLQKASHAYFVMLDNQNTVPEWAADTLCRLVTGEADSKRRLYTDDEDVIVELRRAVLLNGINVPTDRGDVLDRSLVVELERIPDGERRTEEELWERFEEEHPNYSEHFSTCLTRQ